MSTDHDDPRPDEFDDAPRDAGDDAVDDRSAADLAAEVELLREENDRLREEYARARRAEYRRTAVGLLAVGTLAALAGVAFPDARTVLFALAGTGLFAAVLTYWLAPERVIPASVGERVYDALAGNELAAATALGLADRRVYVPAGGATDDAAGVRLFVPQRERYAVPEESALAGTFVVTDEPAGRGLALRPSGSGLFAEFRESVAGDLAEDPGRLADQLADGVVATFELAGSAATEVDPEDGRATVAVSDSAFGPVDRFDHPVPSLVAVGFARGLDRPVEASTTPAEGDRADYLVTCEWDVDGDDGTTGDADGDDGPA